MITSTTQLFDFERFTIERDTREALSALGLPDSLPGSWSRPAHPLRRAVVLARAEGELAGAALIVSRMFASYVKVAGIWVASERDRASVEAALVSEVESDAWNAGAVVVKREYQPEDQRGHGQEGYVPVVSPAFAGPIPDVIDHVPSAAFRWRAGVRSPTVPYMRQTSDYTCGPASLLMALSHFGKHPAPDRESEFGLWREATLGESCGPYGMALTAAKHGLSVDLTISTHDFVLMEDLESEQARNVSRFIQAGLRSSAHASGIDAAVRWFDAEDVRAVLDSGRLAIVLIDQNLFHGEVCPHWIVVHTYADGVFLAHDPWTEVSAGETWVDGYDLPLGPAALERVARFGEPPYGALLAVGR